MRGYGGAARAQPEGERGRWRRAGKMAEAGARPRLSEAPSLARGDS